MRLNRLAAFAAVAVLALGVSACGGDDDGEGSGSGDVSTDVSFAAGSTMQKLHDAKKIKIGTKYDQPGFGLKGLDGKPAGFDVEIAKIIAHNLGLTDDQIEWSEAPSAVREQVIEQGTVDIVVATYTINDTRKERIDFAGPYYVAGQDIMTRADDTSITGVEDLNGKKVCSVQGSTSIENVKEAAPDADLSLSFDRYSLCAEALADGRVDAVSSDNVILLGLSKAQPGKFRLVGKLFTTEPYGIGMAKGADELRDFVNDRLEEIYADGSWKAAFDRTVGTAGEEAPDPPPVDRY